MTQFFIDGDGTTSTNLGTDFSAFADVRDIDPGDSTLSNAVGTAKVILQDLSGASLPFAPELGMEVAVWPGGPMSSSTFMVFGGQIGEIDLSNLPGRGVRWELSLQDWNEALNHAYCKTSTGIPAPFNDADLVRYIMLEAFDKTLSGNAEPAFTSQTAQYVKRHPITALNEAPPYSGINRPRLGIWPYVKPNIYFGSTLPFDFAGMTAKAALDRLAALIPGLYYRVDQQKYMFWQVPIADALYIVSSKPDGLYSVGFENYSEKLTRGDQGTRYALTGGGGSGTAYVYDEPTYARYGVPGTGIAGENNASGSRHGGIRDLPYESDTTVTDPVVLRQRAYAKLKGAQPRRTITFTTQERALFRGEVPLQPGQLLSVVNYNLGTGTGKYAGLHSPFMPFAGAAGLSNSGQLSDSRGKFLILTVHERLLGNGVYEYEVTCGDIVRDLPTALA